MPAEAHNWSPRPKLDSPAPTTTPTESGTRRDANVPAADAVVAAVVVATWRGAAAAVVVAERVGVAVIWEWKEAATALKEGMHF